jgi:hypothetical protein
MMPPASELLGSSTKKQYGRQLQSALQLGQQLGSLHLLSLALLAAAQLTAATAALCFAICRRQVAESAVFAVLTAVSC